MSPSVWINCLWFLSLVLSLTSALFGMIAKQWLREYMQWKTTSWLPQRFIALRQRRYEALMKWKVPAIIATIPVLLEIALILFFIGLAVLLWTINGIVTGLYTAAISVSVYFAFVTTALPSIWPRCPYKTPAGWAFLRTVWLLSASWAKRKKQRRHDSREIEQRGAVDIKRSFGGYWTRLRQWIIHSIRRTRDGHQGDEYNGVTPKGEAVANRLVILREWWRLRTWARQIQTVSVAKGRARAIVPDLCADTKAGEIQKLER